MKKESQLKKARIPFIIYLVALFYFACTLFYFAFGFLFSNALLYFGNIMAASPDMLSDSVFSNVAQMSDKLLVPCFPILSYSLQNHQILVSSLAILSSALFFVIGFGLLRGINFARIIAILFSIIEICLGVQFLFEGDIFGGILHISLHLFMVLYLFFSMRVRTYFLA